MLNSTPLDSSHTTQPNPIYASTTAPTTSPHSTTDTDSIEDELVELLLNWHKLSSGVKGAILLLAKRGRESSKIRPE